MEIKFIYVNLNSLAVIFEGEKEACEINFFLTLKHIFLLYTKFKNTNLIKNAYEISYT